MSEQVHLVVYGGDSSIENGLFLCGIETKLRCDKAVSFLQKQLFSRATIYLGAGHDPKRATNNRLAHAMRAYIKEGLRAAGLTDRVSVVVASKDVWGSIDESKAVAKELELYEVRSFFVVTSWHHMLRVRLIWKLIGGFDPKSIWAKKKWGIKSFFYEFIFLFATKVDFNARNNGKKLTNPWY